MTRKLLNSVIGATGLWVLSVGMIYTSVSKREGTPLFITDICVLENGAFLVTEKGSKQLSRYDPKFETLLQQWTFGETPTGVTTVGNQAYVTTFETRGELHAIDLSKEGEAKPPLKVGSGANSPLPGSKSGELIVLNQFSDNVMFIDLNSWTVKKTVQVLREPTGAVIDNEGRYLFVANHLPAQRADIDTVAACVSVIDLKTYTKVKDIQLYNGSNALRGICLSADGKYVFVSHNLGRFQVPTNQLQQGWMNTSGVSIINVASLHHEGTVLLDDPERGAAGVWGVACTEDRLLVSHSGTHELSVINYPQFIDKFEAYPQKDALAYDLRFLYGLRTRVPLQGNGPRTFAVKDQQVYVPTYFSDDMNRVNLADLEVKSLALVAGRKETSEQAGEKYFNDAEYCFQNWQSCNGCHPGDARTDAMNWDLMNDGIGNSKNCKSLLYSHVTNPSMISGIRETAELAVRKGYALIQFCDFAEEKAVCVDHYLRSLRPVPSPYLVDGKLSSKAEAGRRVFDKLECGSCHSGPYFTDQKLHRIGEEIEFEQGWDTPTLIEVWRTAPYLFNGRAATLNDVFETDKHGVNQKISKKEIDELVEYVNSL